MAEDRDEASSCEHVHGPSGCGGKFLDQLRGYWFLKMEFPERNENDNMYVLRSENMHPEGSN